MEYKVFIEFIHNVNFNIHWYEKYGSNSFIHHIIVVMKNALSAKNSNK